MECRVSRSSRAGLGYRRGPAHDGCLLRRLADSQEGLGPIPVLDVSKEQWCIKVATTDGTSPMGWYLRWSARRLGWPPSVSDRCLGGPRWCFGPGNYRCRGVNPKRRPLIILVASMMLLSLLSLLVNADGAWALVQRGRLSGVIPQSSFVGPTIVARECCRDPGNYNCWLPRLTGESMPVLVNAAARCRDGVECLWIDLPPTSWWWHGMA